MALELLYITSSQVYSDSCPWSVWCVHLTICHSVRYTHIHQAQYTASGLSMSHSLCGWQNQHRVSQLWTSLTQKSRGWSPWNGQLDLTWPDKMSSVEVAYWCQSTKESCCFWNRSLIPEIGRSLCGEECVPLKVFTWKIYGQGTGGPPVHGVQKSRVTTVILYSLPLETPRSGSCDCVTRRQMGSTYRLTAVGNQGELQFEGQSLSCAFRNLLTQEGVYQFPLDLLLTV